MKIAFTALTVLFAGALLATPLRGALMKGDIIRGKRVYDDQCTGCHALDENRYGPAQRSLYGSKAAMVPGYGYTARLKASGIVWTEAMLDRWLTNSQALVPGSRMVFALPDAQARADVIAFLQASKAQRPAR
ncbi:MAG: hypothetical protein RIS52_127 [Pseudomonadota bacterium]|jgi:cytochrome c